MAAIPQRNDRLTMTVALMLKNLYPHNFRDFHSEYYVKPRTEDLWVNYMLGRWSEDEFKRKFRVTFTQYKELCDMLQPRLQGGSTNYKKPLSVEKKVAIGLYRLSREHCTYSTLEEIFAVGEGTACKAFYQFVNAVVQVRGIR